MSTFCSTLLRSSETKEFATSSFCDSEPILAVATSNSAILLYDVDTDDDGNDGNLIEQITCESIPVQLDWKPRSTVLLAGCENGAIYAWSIKQRASVLMMKDNVHRNSLSFLLWNNSGTCLISGDNDGLCCVWREDSRGHIVPVKQYRNSSALTTAVFSVPSQDAAAKTTDFFIGTSSGVICIADDLGQCNAVQQMSSSVRSLLLYEDKKRLVAITRSLVLSQLQVQDGSATPFMKVKLSSAGDEDGAGSPFVWVSSGVIASARKEHIVRFVDLRTDENYVLSLSSAGLAQTERAISISFNARQRYLAVGTQQGQCIIWKHVGVGKRFSSDDEEEEARREHASEAKQWMVHSTCTLDSGFAITSLKWGPGLGILEATTETGHTYIIREESLFSICNDGLAAVQVSSQVVLFERLYEGISFKLETPKLKGIACNSHHAIMWGRKRVWVYLLDEGEHCRHVTDFACKANSIALRENTLFIAQKKRIIISTLQGARKLSIHFTEEEGNPIMLDLKQNNLVVVTDRMLIKTYNISKADPEPVGKSGSFVDSANKPVGVIRSIKCNADGSCVSIISDRIVGSLNIVEPDSRICLFDTSRGTLSYFDFGTGCVPVSHSWDTQEAKLLSCQTASARWDDKCTTKGQFEPEPVNAPTEKSEIVTLFVTPDGAYVHDKTIIDPKSRTALVGINAPTIFIVRRQDGLGLVDISLTRKLMRDFSSLENADLATKGALMNFSYFLLTGDTDKAYQSVKDVTDPSVWENMAHLCVRKRHLDISEICLAKMGHARGAAAIRLAKSEPEEEAILAVVAIQLGLLEEAASLYQECRRYDLLNKLYQRQGRWDDAIAVAKEHDHVHLKTTYHEYAKHLQSIGDITGAIRGFEMAGMGTAPVRQMFVAKQDFDGLEGYVKQTKDLDLLRWWAGYCESQGCLEKAKDYYTRADDSLSLVRLSCLAGDFDAATSIVSKSGCAAAAYHLATIFESAGDAPNALAFYARSGALHHAIRLAKVQGNDQELMTLALAGNPSTMKDCADFFEDEGDLEKAATLYQKSGDLPKVLQLTLEMSASGKRVDDILTGLIGQLAGRNEDVESCASALIQYGQYDKAVALYTESGRLEEAIAICTEHKVNFSESVLKRMEPPEANDREQNANRKVLLKKLAEACEKQGNYDVASKKYIEAGDRLKAMHCLLKGGDTKRVISFANVCRKKDIYLLAANYLQHLDWHGDPDVMRAIVQFYTKAQSFERLFTFYGDCARIEIDEYQDYERALGALTEAGRWLSRANSPRQGELTRAHTARLDIVERFVTALRARDTDPDGMESTCLDLLSMGRAAEEAIQMGDCFAALVDHYVSHSNHGAAFDMLQRMEDRGVAVGQYIEADIVEQIHHAVGKKHDQDDDETGADADVDIEEVVESDDSFARTDMHQFG